VTPSVRKKAYAYVVWERKLLVFTQPDFPEAGIQVPAGTVRDRETSEQAALREAAEETGRTDLEVVTFLGSDIRDMTDFGRNELHARYFFHLCCRTAGEERWRSYEYLEDGTPPIAFDFFWASLDDLPSLIAGHDRFVPELRRRIALATGD
jgi:8-oxo-dGTP diphosphatase